MHLARWSQGGVFLSLVGACAPATPPPLTPNPDSQEVIVESDPEPDAFEGSWETSNGSQDGSPSGETAAKTEPQSNESSPAESASEEKGCHGSPTDALMQNLRKRGATSRGCFAALLRRGTEARGQVKVALEISEKGRIDHFDLEGDDPGDVEFTECLAEHFKIAFSTTPPEGGCVTVKIPLNFSVKKGS